MIILQFPELRQSYEYDCGVKALQSVLAYYGIDISEEKLMKLTKVSKDKGTSISSITSVLHKYSLHYNSAPMTMKQLREYIAKGIPVIILLQAWNQKSKNYQKDYHDGHFVVAIGYNRNEFIFEDPYKFVRTYLTTKELLLRWHGTENDEKISKWGIAVWGDKPGINAKTMIHMD